MTATLRLTRESMLIELRRGTFTASLDGNTVGTIESQGSLDVPIEPGQHVLKIQKGRYSSPAHTFNAIEGQIASFHCHGASVWPRYVASIVKPDLAIKLAEQKL